VLAHYSSLEAGPLLEQRTGEVVVWLLVGGVGKCEWWKVCPLKEQAVRGERHGGK